MKKKIKYYLLVWGFMYFFYFYFNRYALMHIYFKVTLSINNLMRSREDFC